MISPLVFIDIHSNNSAIKYRYIGFIYTDDDGETWQTSNLISIPEDRSAVWEPYGYEQYDGKLRVLIRNISRRCTNPLLNMLSCVRTGLEKGQPLVLESDPQYVAIETVSEKPQVIKCGPRYLMLKHDTYCWQRPFENRIAPALFFGPTGKDDFIAGPSFTDKNEIGAYPPMCSA